MSVRGIGTEDIDAKLSISTIHQIALVRKLVGIEASNNVQVAARAEIRRGIEQERLHQQRKERDLRRFLDANAPNIASDLMEWSDFDPAKALL